MVGSERTLGVVQHVNMDGTYIIAMGEEGKSGDERTANLIDLEIVPPKQHDSVKILGGELRGSTGKLIGVDGQEGIVRVDNNDVKLVDISNLGRHLA